MYSHGQKEDSRSSKTKEVIGQKEKEEKIARKTALKSAIFPGWGQFSNGKLHLLKLPIIYGGFATLAILGSRYHDKFKCYENGFYLTSNGFDFDGCDGFTTPFALKNGMDSYRQRRDLMVIIGVGFYALNVIDAYIWAHLKQFDDSEEISLHLRPQMLNIARQPIGGLSLSLRF